MTDAFHPPEDGAPVGPPAGVAEIVGELRYVIESARPLPLSASSTINKEDVLAIIDEIQTRMPDELRSARWLLKEREEFRAKMRREGDEIVALARNRAEQMVQRTQVVKAAEARARKVLEVAEEVGLDMDRLRRDMQSPEIKSYISETVQLGEALQFQGTPTFVIGGAVIGGAVPKEVLVAAIAAARAGALQSGKQSEEDLGRILRKFGS